MNVTALHSWQNYQFSSLKNYILMHASSIVPHNPKVLLVRHRMHDMLYVHFIVGIKTEGNRVMGGTINFWKSVCVLCI